MATHSPPSANQTTTGEHREEELRKARLVLFLLLTFNSCLAIYLLWGDLVSVASAGATYVALGLLLGRRFGCWEPRTDGGRRWLDAVIWFLFLSLLVLQVSRLARTAASSMLVAVAGATALALGVGGCCAYLLHRRSWSKQQRQEATFLPLRQDPHTVD